MIVASLSNFFPEDAHRPCMKIGGIAEPVRKLVVKVAL